MADLEVKLKSIDDSAKKLRYPSRTIEMRYDGTSIQTPTRCSTAYEYNQKANIPIEIPLRNPVSLKLKRLSRAQLEKLLTENGTYGRLLRNISYDTSVAQYSVLRFVSVQPSLGAEKDKQSAMELLSESKLRQRFLRLLIQMQTQAGLTTVTIPYLNLGFDILKEIIKAVNDDCEKNNLTPLFFVDLKYNNFSKLLSWLINKTNCNLIGLLYKAYESAPISYETLYEYHDKDVAFLMADVPRYDKNHYDFATMHSLPFLGNDLFAIQTPHPYIPDENNPKKTEPKPRLDSIRVFRRSELKVDAIKSINNLDFLLTDIDGTNDSSLRKMLSNIEDVNYKEDNYDSLNGFTRVHELITSSSEFSTVQKYIRDNSSKDYIEEKKILKQILPPKGDSRISDM